MVRVACGSCAARRAGVLLVTTGLCVSVLGGAKADEGGVSFWLPGQFGSLAAAPQTPGWSFASIYYHTSVSAGGATAASREVTTQRFNTTVKTST